MMPMLAWSKRNLWTWVFLTNPRIPQNSGNTIEKSYLFPLLLPVHAPPLWGDITDLLFHIPMGTHAIILWWICHTFKQTKPCSWSRPTHKMWITLLKLLQCMRIMENYPYPNFTVSNHWYLIPRQCPVYHVKTNQKFLNWSKFQLHSVVFAEAPSTNIVFQHNPHICIKSFCQAWYKI